MQFDKFAAVIAARFQEMTTTGLFRTDVPKDDLWSTYLESFTPESNPIFKTRTEHDCTCCRQFVKTLGGVVTIRNGQIETLWDVDGVEQYKPVVNALASLVRRHAIENVFLHSERSVGTAQSLALSDLGQTIRWKHFFVNLPTDAVVPAKDLGPKLSETHSTFDVMLRGLMEITSEAVDTVLELIGQNSLYRGEEQAGALHAFKSLQEAFAEREGPPDLFCWSRLRDTSPAVARLRNTALGTLLLDLSNGVELEDAVKAFERIVAPTNYKRPTALVTKAMIAKAEEKIRDLGLLSALERRYATLQDITINNVLFADRSAKREMNVFEELAARTPGDQKLDRIEDVPIEAFLRDVLPKAERLEAFFENRHAGNLMSLIAPADPTAKRLFKWPNNFSWSYAGELTDSIRERVKAAGGSVTGDFRASLSWGNYDDLDLHLIEPSGYHIYFSSKRSPITGGTLDVDMNAGYRQSRSPVENITYESHRKMRAGEYRLFVHQYNQRETTDVGFEVELEFLGTIYSFAWKKALRLDDEVAVAKFRIKNGKLELIDSLPHAQMSRTLWNVPTQTFHPVHVVMLSPNHWDERAIGNRHFFFMLEGCRNEEKTRGFFNEFLSEELTPHRKVLEMVGSKMRTDESERQLSGLGFSSTQRNSILVRVGGSFNRVINVTF